jgi:hypothetical protein
MSCGPIDQFSFEPSRFLNESIAWSRRVFLSILHEQSRLTYLLDMLSTTVLCVLAVLFRTGDANDFKLPRPQSQGELIEDDGKGRLKLQKPEFYSDLDSGSRAGIGTYPFMRVHLLPFALIVYLWW